MRRLFHQLVAHSGNDYSPTLLQKIAMVGLACLVILSFVMSSLHTLLWQYSDWLVGTILPAVVTDLTNTERTRYSAPTLTRNVLLDEAARLKAEHMAAEGYFSHYSPGGISPWFWFDRVGYTYAHAGENLAVHFFDSAEVVKAWMNSPTHKANIVNDVYAEIGIGVARGRYEGFDTIFVVQLFGTPARLPGVDVTPLALDIIPDRPSPSRAVASLPEVETTTVPSQEVAGLEVESALSQQVRERVLESVPPSEVVSVREIETATGGEETEVLLVTTGDESPLLAAETSVFSSLSTTSGLQPAPVRDELQSAGTSAPMLAQLATQPSAWLRYMYIAIGSLVIFSLLTSVLIGWRRHRPLEVAYGTGLLVVMAGCYYLHAALTSGVVIM